jgi:hypothetical protein
MAQFDVLELWCGYQQSVVPSLRWFVYLFTSCAIRFVLFPLQLSASHTAYKPVLSNITFIGWDTLQAPVLAIISCNELTVECTAHILFMAVILVRHCLIYRTL